VSQSRKRTFIWGAAPGEALPDWPRLMHVFRSPQLTIRLPGGVAYTAVPQVHRSLCQGQVRADTNTRMPAQCGVRLCRCTFDKKRHASQLLIPCSLRRDAIVPALQTAGAPLRTVTVRDTIGDLPPVENGEDREEMPYGGELAACLSRTQQADMKLEARPFSNLTTQFCEPTCRHHGIASSCSVAQASRPRADILTLTPI